MNKIKVLYFSTQNFTKKNINTLKSEFDLKVIENPSLLNKIKIENFEVIFAPLGYYFSKNIIKRAKKLEIIASNTTGINHIDYEYAISKDIKIFALHNEKKFLKKITPTAEHTIGLMMSLYRNIPWSFEEVIKKNVWNRYNWSSPKMLSRMSIGIVGYGRLGKKIAKFCKVLNMNVYWFDPYVKGGEKSLTFLANKSDILSINCSVTKKNYHLINRKILLSLRKGSYIINTARGELLNIDDLIDLMETGHIKGAALDTLEFEFDSNFLSYKSNNRALSYAKKNKNLIITPHIGGSTEDAWDETQRKIIDKIIKFFNEKKNENHRIYTS